MVGCAEDGYVYFVFGPFNANHNDAQILRECFDKYENTLSVLQDKDVIIVDDGFRVCDFLINEKHFRTYIPGTGERDTLEANEARFVTKVRWIIFWATKEKI